MVAAVEAAAVHQGGRGLIPIVHRYRLISLPILDAICVRLYADCDSAEEEKGVDCILTALFCNVKAG